MSHTLSSGLIPVCCFAVTLCRCRLQRLMWLVNVTVHSPEFEILGGIYWGALLPEPPPDSLSVYALVISTSLNLVQKSQASAPPL